MLTDEQKQQRLGKFTASEIYKIMGKRGMGKTGESYVYEKVAEKLTGIPKDTPETFAMQWGIEHEPEAAAYYEAAKKVQLQEAETIVTGMVAATPDRLTDSHGIEIKCPFNSANHLKSLAMDRDGLKEVWPEYYWQIMTGMLLTHLELWHFVSYDPRFQGALRMVVIPVEVDQKDMDDLKLRIQEATALYNKILAEVS